MPAVVVFMRCLRCRIGRVGCAVSGAWAFGMFAGWGVGLLVRSAEMQPWRLSALLCRPTAL